MIFSARAPQYCVLRLDKQSFTDVGVAPLVDRGQNLPRRVRLRGRIDCSRIHRVGESVTRGFRRADTPKPPSRRPDFRGGGA